ncbi:methyltransferase domain-containing protein [Methanosphaerula palustris]|uniref:Methyltransferase type 11 n=1 Tax=Methanosphaerula palustris (strain ATCC BAA-1556 / DSM 19958 / E1-9c) TaxID=521011 RepID=B8GKH6_METPE|nr:methyltransferase domain-containing protein [Methanosphaerula palustris]ACL15859.1 Methyltransferase type 11 [Methanosphaerula palustris E1-9c]
MTYHMYVHGYSARESERLTDQAQTLTELLHRDTRYSKGSQVLEAGCGIGAQTVILARNSPDALITSVDISEASLKQAQETIQHAGITNVTFRQGDIFHLPFKPATFDHIFVCFVLEHLTEPQQGLERLRPLLKEGGTLTVIEGDHGSAFFHPDDPDARQAIDCLVELQHQAGGNALIGRQLYPLIANAGYRDLHVSPRMVYIDASRPGLVEGFTKLTFAAMVEGVADEVEKQGLMNQDAWKKGITALYHTTEPGGVFCYTFFKATARR